MKTRIMLLVLAILFGLAPVVSAQETEASSQKIGGVKSLEKRIKQLEDAVARDVEGDRWLDRIQIGGAIEIEAAYQDVDVKDEENEKSSDIDLATVEMAIDAKIATHVDGHVLFKYEEDDVFVDEGFITLTGTESLPGYLIAGRQYLPFGYYDSYFITDPKTLVLGETNQGALVAGYRFGGEMVDVSIGAFNGSVNEIDEDDHIDSFVAGIFSNPVEGLMIGVSYTSNLASSDTFSEFVNEEIDSLIGGWSAYVTYAFLERFKIIAEYTSSIDSFKAGEAYGEEDTKERQPAAWNAEAGAVIIENLEMALRYGGADDGGVEFLPESQFGVLFYGNRSPSIRCGRSCIENGVRGYTTPHSRPVCAAGC